MLLAKKLLIYAVLGFASFLLCGGVSFIVAMTSGVAARGQIFYINNTFTYVAFFCLMLFGMWLIDKSWTLSPKLSKQILGAVAGFCLIFGTSCLLDLFV